MLSTQPNIGILFLFFRFISHRISFGIDGLRLDHCIGPSHSFWREFRKEVKQVNPSVILIGEAWYNGDLSGDAFQSILMPKASLLWFIRKVFRINVLSFAMLQYVDVLDGCMDFQFHRLVTDYFTTSHWKWFRFIPWSIFQSKLKLHYWLFPKSFILPTFLDNHDTNRFLFKSKNSREKLEEAAKFQFAQNQPAIIYYGTEQGMTHDVDIYSKPFGDLECRKIFDWKRKDLFLNFYKSLILAKIKSN
jgi:cyclomaltodextrinase